MFSVRWTLLTAHSILGFFPEQVEGIDPFPLLSASSSSLSFSSSIPTFLWLAFSCDSNSYLHIPSSTKLIGSNLANTTTTTQPTSWGFVLTRHSWIFARELKIAPDETQPEQPMDLNPNSNSEILQHLDLTAIINLNAESSSEHLLLIQLEIFLHDSSSSTESLR